MRGGDKSTSRAATRCRLGPNRQEAALGAPLIQIETDNALPQAADCVVIGGGIVGTSAAYWLARAGLSVVLLEKGRVGAEQSSRNWGWCRQQNRDRRELALARRALDLWERMQQDIGESLGFRRCGLLFLSNDPAEIDTWDRWGRFARGEGVDTRLLDSAAATEHGAATGRRWLGGVWSPDDGTADPSRAAPVIAAACRRLGGVVLQGCAARGLERTGGAVSAVIAEHGTIRTSRVVMAGGVWASSFLHQYGVRFPQASVRCSIMSLMPGAQNVPDALFTRQAAVTRRGDGGYGLAISMRAHVDPEPGMLAEAREFIPMYVKRWRQTAPGGLQGWRAGFGTRRIWAPDAPTPMEAQRILDPRPSRSVLRQVLANARDLLPALKDVPVQAEWAGFIDSTPDSIPVIDAVAEVPGLILAAGCSGHGFAIGPGAGKLAADIALGQPLPEDAPEFRLARFRRRGLLSGRHRVADF